MELREINNSWCINRLNDINQDRGINLPYCYVLSNNAIQNVLKVVFLKYLNNTLLFDYQLSKFMPNVNPWCSSCTRIPFLPPYQESSTHILRDCLPLKHIRTITCRILSDILHIEIDCPLIDRNDFLFNNIYGSAYASTIMCLYIAFIYKYRKSVLVTDPNFYIDYLDNECKKIAQLSSKFNLWYSSSYLKAYIHN